MLLQTTKAGRALNDPGDYVPLEIAGEQRKLQVFSMRSMASGAAFHRAYHRATQQAFFDAHEHAFHYFGGVFRLLS